MIKARRLSEVKELLTGPEFTEWWNGLSQAKSALAAASERYDELLTQAMLMDFRAELAQKNAIDTLYRSGELEDTAAGLLANSNDLDNQSFKTLSDFEALRIKVSDLWYRLGAAERQLDELRDQLGEFQRQRERLPSTANPAAKRELESKLGIKEHELKQSERAYRTLHSDYERESAKKNRIWDEVERIWARSAEMSLGIAEKRTQARKVRREAEALFAQAEERKRKAAKLREEAELASQTREKRSQEVQERTRQAREKFGCAVGDEFLYFRERDQANRALAVGLVADSQSYNLEIKPLAIYAVERTKGVAFLEPAVEGHPSQEEGDKRFEDYFLQGRKGTRRVEKAAS
jgi:hypothetical protein